MTTPVAGRSRASELNQVSLLLLGDRVYVLRIPILNIDFKIFPLLQQLILKHCLKEAAAKHGDYLGEPSTRELLHRSLTAFFSADM